MANSPGAQELMTFASGPALVKWPQHLQQEHGDCQRKFGLISPLPPHSTTSALPPFQSHFHPTLASNLLISEVSFFFFFVSFLWLAEEGANPKQPSHLSNKSSQLRYLCNTWVKKKKKGGGTRGGDAEDDGDVSRWILDSGSGQKATRVRAV